MRSRLWRLGIVLLAVFAIVLVILLGPGRNRPTGREGAVRTSPGASPPVLKMQRVSSDPFTDPGSQHATEVEPDTFAYGDKVVSTFQAGRFDRGGGASSIGFATSKDRGQTWSSGFLPSLTVVSTPSGPSSRASDPTVAFDAIHGVWLIASLRCSAPPKACGDGPTELVVSRSVDGVSWMPPLIVASGDYDKSWIVCDNGGSSAFRGTCYTSWTDVPKRRTLTSSAIDGGVFWSHPQPADRMLGVQPVVQPNGTLIITGEDERARTILSIRSTDGGRTFGRAVIIARFRRSSTRGFRTEQLPSSEVDGSGAVYVAWEDCRFTEGCRTHDIVISSSLDGVDWSSPRAVPLRGPNAGQDAVLPGLAVDPASAGQSARLGLTFYSFVRVPCTPSSCRLNVGFVSSDDAGESWTDVVPLTVEAMALTALPRTNLGRMAGDYISTSFLGDVAVTVFPQAAIPQGSVSGPDRRFDQAMSAATIPV